MGRRRSQTGRSFVSNHTRLFWEPQVSISTKHVINHQHSKAITSIRFTITADRILRLRIADSYGCYRCFVTNIMVGSCHQLAEVGTLGYLSLSDNALWLYPVGQLFLIRETINYRRLSRLYVRVAYFQTSRRTYYHRPNPAHYLKL